VWLSQWRLLSARVVEEMKTVIGISALRHDAAAAAVTGNQIIAAAQEERFSRRRHDPRFLMLYPVRLAVTGSRSTRYFCRNFFPICCDCVGT
jgi:hypothetical protein